jgi:hypothetical protein
MNEASSLLLSHVKEGVLSDEDFSQFLKLAEALPVSSTRQAAIEHLLRIVHLNPSQVQLLAHTEILQDNPSLQLTLKRYVRVQEYASAREGYENRSKWTKIAEFLMMLSPF